MGLADHKVHQLICTFDGDHRPGVGGDVVVADGPFAETEEQVGSLLIVDCKHLDHATQIAARIPAAWYGTIEARPVWEPPLAA